jgi:hypothetical protein
LSDADELVSSSSTHAAAACLRCLHHVHLLLPAGKDKVQDRGAKRPDSSKKQQQKRTKKGSSKRPASSIQPAAAAAAAARKKQKKSKGSAQASA